MCVCVCECVYLEEDSLQLSAVFPTVLLGEDDSVCWDAVVRHPAVALQHPDHDVWKTVLRLRERRRRESLVLVLSVSSQIRCISEEVDLRNGFAHN